MLPIFLGTFFTLTAEDITAILGYAKDLILDLQPLLLIIVGISAGLLIFWGIIWAIKH